MEMESYLFENLIDGLDEGIFFIDRNMRIVYWNRGCEKITGVKASKAIGAHCCQEILDHADLEGNSLCHNVCPVGKTLEDGKIREIEVYLQCKKGGRTPIFLRIIPLLDKSGAITGAAHYFMDITMKLDMQQKMKELKEKASIDLLTDLPNRALIDFNLNSRLNEFLRNGSTFGVLMMDIDHFKDFNDKYGHDVGDEVLKMVAKVFLSNERPYDVIGRWGGEEFVGVVANIDKFGLFSFAERLRYHVERMRLIVGKKKLKVTISIGATLALPTDNQDKLLKRADELLYRCKNNGRNCVTVG
ncbi:MAG: sensor domain-containing diguanylate cyclase [Candidatus Omnitrophota bacterium]